MTLGEGKKVLWKICKLAKRGGISEAGVEQKKVIRQEDQKLLREVNKERNEQLRLLSDEQKMKKLHVAVLI